MSKLLDAINESVGALSTQWVDALSDGRLTVAEIGSLVSSLVGNFVLVSEAAGGTGLEKKAAVLTAIDMLYDKHVMTIKLPLLLRPWGNMLHTSVKMALRLWVADMIDKLVSDYNQSEWPKAGE